MLAALRRQGLTRHHCNAIARQLNTRPRGAARLSDAARMLQPVLVSVALQSWCQVVVWIVADVDGETVARTRRRSVSALVMPGRRGGRWPRPHWQKCAIRGKLLSI